jgi:hypothetical protein
MMMMMMMTMQTSVAETIGYQPYGYRAEQGKLNISHYSDRKGNLSIYTQ